MPPLLRSTRIPFIRVNTAFNSWFVSNFRPFLLTAIRFAERRFRPLNHPNRYGSERTIRERRTFRLQLFMGLNIVPMCFANCFIQSRCRTIWICLLEPLHLVYDQSPPRAEGG